MGLVVGITVSILCLAIGSAVAGFLWNRKRKEVGVVALHKVRLIKDDSYNDYMILTLSD